MADKLEVQVTGRSIAEIAHIMASEILFNVEGKKWEKLSRAEYLNAHADAVDALQGVHFDVGPA